MTAVLVVEDDEGDAILVSERLVVAGFERADVIWRRTLAEGIAALRLRPSCVLLDLGLPDADGLRALQRLVERAAGVPVIVLTGRNDGTGDDAVAAGAQDYLVKDDITPELLDRSIRYAIERARAQSAELQLKAQQLVAAENARLERGLLPTPLLHSRHVACQTYYQPGSDLAVLGGDFFDVIETPDGRTRAVIGDVMGHGPDEAALGVHLRVAWRSLVLAGVADGELFATLARVYAAESSGGSGFVTVCDLTIDPDFVVSVRNAGHPPPLLNAGGATEYLDVVVGPPLGVERVAPFRSGVGGSLWPATVTPLPTDSSLVLYTDGLLECYRDPADRASLGVEELLRAASLSLGRGAVSTWIPTLLGKAPRTSADDTAVVVLTLKQPDLATELARVVEAVEPPALPAL